MENVEHLLPAEVVQFYHDNNTFEKDVVPESCKPKDDSTEARIDHHLRGRWFGTRRINNPDKGIRILTTDKHQLGLWIHTEMSIWYFKNNYIVHKKTVSHEPRFVVEESQDVFHKWNDALAHFHSQWVVQFIMYY